MIRKLAVLLMIGLLFAGCGGKKGVKPPPPSDPRPVSHQVTEVESTSSAETLLRATGKGAIVEYAIADAQKAALWFLLFAGTKPLLKSQDEKRAFNNVEEKLYRDVDKYIRHTSELKSKKKVGKTTEVEVVVKIDVAMLKEFLVDNGVIQAMEDVVEEVGMPSISMIAAESGADSDIARNVLGEYFTDRNFEVNVVEQSGKLSGIINKLATLSGNTDPSYAWALEAGTDVYVEVKVNKEKGQVSGVATKKASVTAKAFETSTGRQLGASTGNSSERAASGYDALIQEAANAVADKLVSQIRKKWMKEAEKGKTFKVVAFTTESQGSQVDSALYKALKSMAVKGLVKRVGAGKSTFEYQMRFTDIKNAFDLLEALKDRYTGPGKITREMESGTMLVVKAGSGDIDIQFD